MTTERFDGKDRRLVLVLLLAAAVSVVYTAYNFYAAFPQASINLRYSKDQISAMAERFLKEHGLNVAGFRQLTLFDPDEAASLYLERELGLEAANRLMERTVSVWRWRARWFRPPQKEEMTVWLSPEGRMVGFEHEIREDAAGARLGKEAARAMAEDFLRRQTAEPQRFIEEQRQDRPNRYDYVFTWEQEGFRAKEATYRRTVEIQGDRIGSYQEFLYVPEKWKRDFAALRASNELYTDVAQVLYVLLMLGAAGMLIQWARKKHLRWRPLLAISGAVGVFMVVNQWNALPFYIDQAQTSSPYHETLLIGLLQGVGAGMAVFFFVIVAAAAGEPLYRRAQGAALSLPASFQLRGLQTKRAFTAAVVGYAFAAAHIAFVVAFYLIGRKFGVWSPQEVQYSDLLSTRLPWIYPITISLLASTSEEFWFRLYAIPALHRLVKVKWLAIVIPAFIWGFLHANYPQQPAFIRGIEVGVIGVAAGFLMLRYGILSTLIWHFTVDAVMIGMFLFQSKSWYFQLSGWVVAVVIALPLLISVIFYRRNGGFVVEPELLNEDGTAGEGEAPQAPERVVQELKSEVARPAWSAKWLYVAGLAGAVAVVALRPVQFGDFVRVTLTRAQAEAIAGRDFTARVAQASPWRRHVTEFVSNLQRADFEYVRRLAGAGAANQVVDERTTTGVWRVRYFQPLRKEEWRIYVNRDGRAFRADHVLDEKAPGANLPAEEARRIAERYLAEVQRVPVERYRLADSAVEKKDNRTDHNFVWEAPGFNLGEAKARLSLAVQGDEPSAFRRFLKLPEQWLREFARPRLQTFLLPGLVGALSLPLLVVFVMGLGTHRYRWRTYLGVAAITLSIALLSNLNQSPSWLADYDTAKPLNNFIGQALIGRLIGVLLLGVAGFAGALAVDVFLQKAIGERPLNAGSLTRAVCVALLLAGLSRLAGVAEQAVPGPRLALLLGGLSGTETTLPGFAVLAESLMAALGWVAAGTVAVCAAMRLAGLRTRLILLAVIVVAVALSRALTPGQFLFHAVLVLVWVGIVFALVKTCAAELVTFGVAFFWVQVAARAATMVAQPSPWFRWNGVAAAAAAALAGILVVRFCNSTSSREAG